MKKCKVCGGMCESAGRGQYECTSCGSIFSEEDFFTPTSMQKAQVNLKKDDGANLFERVINGVLEINCQGQKTSWVGSGYLISNKGYAMTNAHVAADEDGSPCSKIFVNICGQRITASVVALADDKAGHGNGVDLALIKLASVPYEGVVLAFADFSEVKTGERVFVLGNSLGDGTCITGGIVSDKSRIMNGKTLLMTDCAINGGNSGGPIFNADGKVIGTICSARIKADGSETKGMNYAVPANIVQEFIKRSGIVL